MNNIWLILVGFALVSLTPSASGRQANHQADLRDMVAPLEGWGIPADGDDVPYEADLLPENWTVLPCKPESVDLLCKALLANWITNTLPAEHGLQPQDQKYKWVPRSDMPDGMKPGCAVSEITLDADELRMLHAPGIRVLWVNGEPYQGDPEHKGFLGAPIALKKGINRIVVPKPGAQWRVRFWKPRTQVVLAYWAGSPIGQTQADMGNPFISRFVPAYNVSSNPVDYLHIHYGSPVSPSRGKTGLSEWHCGGTMDPMEMMDISTSDMGIAADLTSDDEFAFYKVMAFENGEALGSIADLPIKHLAVPDESGSPHGWLVHLPETQELDHQRSDLKPTGLPLATRAFFRWLLQNTLYENNGWVSLAEHGLPESYFCRNLSTSRLYLGNERNCSSLKLALEKLRTTDDPEEAPHPAAPRVTNGKMVWKGKEYLGPDWYFVYRPSAEECHLLITGFEALPALIQSFGQDPLHFASKEPSR